MTTDCDECRRAGPLDWDWGTRATMLTQGGNNPNPVAWRVECVDPRCKDSSKPCDALQKCYNDCWNPNERGYGQNSHGINACWQESCCPSSTSGAYINLDSY